MMTVGTAPQASRCMIVPIVPTDPHPIARAALGALLADDGDLDVIEAADLEDGLRAVARRNAAILIVARRLPSAVPTTCAFRRRCRRARRRSSSVSRMIPR
jgi:DNA-binding NarL/FixJ family response regulator